MSVPQAAPKEPDSRAFACPRCRRTFPEIGAPAQCPDDATFLVKAKDLALADRDPMLGRTLEGRYTILARLGAGSMGTVYRARQHAMGREVAIKILRGDRAMDETSKARFLREARANSLLASPNTVTVFDFGESSTGELYLAMELLEGESVGQRLTRVGRLKIEDAVETTRQALRSLGEAHAKGIVHRDLKPDNLFYARVLQGGIAEEIVKVLDFGIAKMLREDAAHLNAIETQAGTVFGTPRYMSPEQAQGKPLDARSDLYSLGVILYQMITGRPPFTDDDAIVVMARHIKTAPRAPSEACPEAHIPAELERVIMRALGKNADDRPANADAFSVELLRAVDPATPTSSGVRRSVAEAASQSAPVVSMSVPPSSLAPPDLIPHADVDAQSRSASRVNMFIGIFLLALALATGIVVYFSVKRPPPEPVASQRMNAPRATQPASTTDPPPATSPSIPLSQEPVGVSPDALPKAHASGTPPLSPPPRNGGKRPRTTPLGSSSAGGYGIFTD